MTLEEAWAARLKEARAVSLLGLCALYGAFGEARTWEKAPELLVIERDGGPEHWARFSCPGLDKPAIMDTMYVRRS